MAETLANLKGFENSEEKLRRRSFKIIRDIKKENDAEAVSIAKIVSDSEDIEAYKAQIEALLLGGSPDISALPEIEESEAILLAELKRLEDKSKVNEEELADIQLLINESNEELQKNKQARTSLTEEISTRTGIGRVEPEAEKVPVGQFDIAPVVEELNRMIDEKELAGKPMLDIEKTILFGELMTKAKKDFNDARVEKGGWKAKLWNKTSKLWDKGEKFWKEDMEKNLLWKNGKLLLSGTLIGASAIFASTYLGKPPPLEMATSLIARAKMSGFLNAIITTGIPGNIMDGLGITEAGKVIANKLNLSEETKNTIKKWSGIAGGLGLGFLLAGGLAGGGAIAVGVGGAGVLIKEATDWGINALIKKKEKKLNVLKGEMESMQKLGDAFDINKYARVAHQFDEEYTKVATYIKWTNRIRGTLDATRMVGTGFATTQAMYAHYAPTNETPNAPVQQEAIAKNEVPTSTDNTQPPAPPTVSDKIPITIDSPNEPTVTVPEKVEITPAPAPEQHQTPIDSAKTEIPTPVEPTPKGEEAPIVKTPEPTEAPEDKQSSTTASGPAPETSDDKTSPPTPAPEDKQPIAENKPVEPVEKSTPVTASGPAPATPSPTPAPEESAKPTEAPNAKPAETAHDTKHTAPEHKTPVTHHDDKTHGQPHVSNENEQVHIVEKGDGGVTQVLKEIHDHGKVPDWFKHEMGENPTAKDWANFAEKIGVYYPDKIEDSLVIHPGDKIGFDENGKLILERDGKEFTLAHVDAKGNIVQDKWQEAMQNEKFMDTDHKHQMGEGGTHPKDATAPNASFAPPPQTDPITGAPISPSFVAPPQTDPTVGASAELHTPSTTPGPESVINNTPILENTGPQGLQGDRPTSEFLNTDHHLEAIKAEPAIKFFEDGTGALTGKELDMYNKINDAVLNNQINNEDLRANDTGHILEVIDSVKEVPSVIQNNINHVYQGNDINAWNDIKDSHGEFSAENMMAMPYDDMSPHSGMTAEIERLSELTGLVPRGESITDNRPPESPQEYLDRATMYAAKHGLLDKVKL